MMLAAAMNGFYGLKRLTGNLPIEPPTIGAGRIRHPFPDERSAELVTIAERVTLPAASARPERHEAIRGGQQKELHN
jgi:hypothetical protein